MIMGSFTNVHNHVRENPRILLVTTLDIHVLLVRPWLGNGNTSEIFHHVYLHTAYVHD